MSRLQIRVYRPIGQTDRWAMVGATESREQIEKWLAEYCYKGLIFHTGFSVLARDVLVDLIPNTHDGIVICAATKALLPDVFDDMRIQVCHGETGEGAIPLSALDAWFFKLEALPDAAKEQEELWLVSSSQKGSMNTASFQPASDLKDLSEELRESLKDNNHLANALLGARITSLDLFRAHWPVLQVDVAFEVAKALFRYGQKQFEQRLENETVDYQFKEYSGIAYLVRYLPPWDASIPKEPVRLYNALRGKGFKTLYELEGLPPSGILKIPHIGKKSILALYEHLKKYDPPYPVQTTEASGSSRDHQQWKKTDHDSNSTSKVDFKKPGLEDAPSLAESLEIVIEQAIRTAKSEKEKRHIEILRRRFAGETLEGIAEGQGVTRERIRQISEKSLKKLSLNMLKASTQETSDLLMLFKLAADLFSKENCSHVEFSNFVRLFAETDKLDLSAPQRRMLEKITPNNRIQFIPFQLDSKPVVLPLTDQQPENIGETLEEVMKSLLERIGGMKAPDAENFAKNQFLSILDSHFFASLFAMEAVFYRSSIDENGVTRTMAERMGGEQAAEEIVRLLREAGRPMHGIDEIYPKMPKLYQDSVNVRRITGHIKEHQERCPGTSADFIFTMGRGRYALWEHFSIRDEDGKRCVEFIEDYLNQHSDRQFTDHDLYEALDHAALVTWEADHVDRHRIVSAILMRYRPSHVRYLGRFVWSAGTWTDQSDSASRYQIHELIEECIKEQGQPVSKQYLDDYIGSIRGRGTNVQYHEQNGVVRLTGTGKHSLYWHESIDPMPFESPEVQALRGEIVELVNHSSTSGLYISGLKADIVRHSDVVSKYSSVQFLALLLRMPEVKVIRNALRKLVVTMEKGTVDA